MAQGWTPDDVKIVPQDFGRRQTVIHLRKGQGGEIRRAGDGLHSLETRLGPRVDFLGIPLEFTLGVNAHFHLGEPDFLSTVGDDKALARYRLPRA